MAAITLEEFKTILDLPLDQTDQDAKINLFLGMAEADYLEIIGKDLAGVFPGSAKRTICEMAQYLLTGQVPEGPMVSGYPSGMVAGIPRYVRVL